VVQVASKAVMPPSISNQSDKISASVGRLAAVGSNGFGYVLAADLPQSPSDATLHVFAPACPSM
jgi:hypothetical protein